MEKVIHTLIEEVNKETERGKNIELAKNATAAFDLLMKLGVTL